jgi:hypothetical protein
MMEAPGTAEPEASLTVPTMVPVTSCANAGRASKRLARQYFNLM